MVLYHTYEDYKYLRITKDNKIVSTVFSYIDIVKKLKCTYNIFSLVKN